MAQNTTRPSRRAHSHRRATFGALLATAVVAAGLVAPVTAHAQSSVQSRLDAATARERALSGKVSTYSALIARLGSDVAALQRHEAVLQARLDAQRRELSRTQEALRIERARLAALRARLAFSRRVLAQRLVHMYQSGQPDLVTVVVTSRGFADLLERGEFMRRINEQDRRVIVEVRTARDAVQLVTKRLAVLEARQERLANRIMADRDEVAASRQALGRRLAGIAQARAQARASLRVTNARRARLLKQLQAQFPYAGALGALAGWAIPWSVVLCESGGRNHSPNHAGASGYYQIIPSTWKGAGGRGPAAYLAPKSEQDRIAAKLWNNGLGAGNWVCAWRR
jgi:peptidoglycan hydrolase CwlO-like protein